MKPYRNTKLAISWGCWYRRKLRRTLLSKVVGIPAVISTVMVVTLDSGFGQSSPTAWVAPESAAALSNQIVADEGSVIRGQEIFNMACASCHGSKGQGDGIAAAALSPKPRDLTNPVVWDETDGALFWKITEGRSPMPAFKGAIDESQVWDVVNFIRTLAPKPEGYQPPTIAKNTGADNQLAGKKDSNSNPQGSEFVTREEYDRLKHKFEELSAQMRLVLGDGSGESAKGDTAATGASSAASNMSNESLSSQVQELQNEVDQVKSGTTRQLLTGYAYAGFTDRSGSGGGFNAGFAPIFLWKPTERLFFEGELEFELEGSETELNLEYAQIVYSLTDQVTIGAGKFLSPFGMFRERLHPAWINKLPDAPLAYGHDGIIPPSILGAQIRGGIPVGQTRLHYSVYVGNGPELNTGADEPEEAGMLHFNNYDDFQNNKAVGGRLGFLPFPALEIGYSGQFANVDAEGTSQQDANAWLHGPYLSYVRDSELLKGVVDIKSEWAWSQVDDLTYDPDGSLGFGPTMFDNSRDGGYAQIAYRPTKLNVRCLNDVETVFRFDRLNLPAGAPESHDENRYSFGLNYWLGPTTVFKASYQFGQRKESGEEAENFDAFLLQAAMGF